MALATMDGWAHRLEPASAVALKQRVGCAVLRSGNVHEAMELSSLLWPPAAAGVAGCAGGPPAGAPAAAAPCGWPMSASVPSKNSAGTSIAAVEAKLDEAQQCRRCQVWQVEKFALLLIA